MKAEISTPGILVSNSNCCWVCNEMSVFITDSVQSMFKVCHKHQFFRTPNVLVSITITTYSPCHKERSAGWKCCMPEFCIKGDLWPLNKPVKDKHRPCIHEWWRNIIQLPVHCHLSQGRQRNEQASTSLPWPYVTSLYIHLLRWLVG